MTAPTTRPLTLDDLGDPAQDFPFDGTYAKDLRWSPDGQSLFFRENGAWLRHTIATGATAPAYDRATVAATLNAHGDFTPADAEQLAEKLPLEPQQPGPVLITHGRAVYAYDLATHQLERLLVADPPPTDALLSPGATWLTYHLAGNLFVVNRASRAVTQLTHDGTAEVLNGRLDWVYQEEVYGRDKWRAYWWRDDERYLAFLQLDQTLVPTYRLQDHRPFRVADEDYRYPLPGDPNARVRLGIVRPTGGPVTWVDLSRYGGADIIICRVSWAPAGRLFFQVQDREGRWLDLNAADPVTGATHTLFRETTPAWVNPLGEPHWLPDGSFLWRSERDGWAHLYHYDPAGQLRAQLTTGPWEVREVHGVDAAAGCVYVTGTLDTALEHHLYRVPLAGGQPLRLTAPGFSHQALFDRALTRYVDTFSNLTTPPRVQLHAPDGAVIRIISENRVPALDEFDLVPPRFLKVPTDNGFLMNVLELRPRAAADPLPVVLETYAGPHAPCVHNRWLGRDWFAKQYLVQHGCLVWNIDPQSASGCGAVSAWTCYLQLGVQELADLEAGLRWLGAQGYADLARVALCGYSYGGFMTSFALTHSTAFQLGIAGASPTDWRQYDSIYTERFMQTPANNPDGYQRTSVVAAAANLSGRLLLVHGLLDDNVHVQNTLQLVYALQQAGKPFDLMLYPGNRHGIRDNARHWLHTRLNYLLTHLQPQ
jgi:dipeptidyl-peptidase-4